MTINRATLAVGSAGADIAASSEELDNHYAASDAWAARQRAESASLG